MPKPVLTDAHKDFIRANRLAISGTKMADKLGLNKEIVNKWMRTNGISAPKHLVNKWRAEANTGRTTFTPAQDEYIKAHYLEMPIKRIGKEIGKSFTGITIRLRQLGITIPPDVVERNRNAGRIKPGAVPPNKGKKWDEYLSEAQQKSASKGWFKKGEPNHNDCGQDGTIRIRQSKGNRPEKFIRLSKSIWMPLRHYVWEQHNGPVPKGMIVAVKDGDPMNVEDINNLELITKKENMQRNTVQRYPESLRNLMQLNGKLKSKIKNEQQRNSTATAST